MQTSTLLSELTKLFAANSVAASITAPGPTVTEPTGDGIIDTKSLAASLGLSNVALAFYAVGADGVTATARVTGWRLIGTLWIPTPLLALALTAGTSVGVAATAILNTERFIDTVTASTAFTTAHELISPVDNTIALVKVVNPGFRYIQVQLAVGTATSVNCIAAGY